ncbi:MAG: WXG100 family type VII secretion target [Agathobacter sp.]|nr:WXG100 family type VII secretion target [Agathobacter sp.]
MAENKKVYASDSDIAKVSEQLDDLAADITSVLGKLVELVGAADGALVGTAGTQLVDTYEGINTTLETYPTTLLTISENLRKTGEIFANLDSEAATAANGQSIAE